MTPEEIQARMRELAEKVYAGRRNLFEVAIDPTRSPCPIRVIVGRGYWDEIRAYRQQVYAGVPLEVATDGRDGLRYTIWGLEIDHDDHELMPHEVRFRSEITL